MNNQHTYLARVRTRWGAIGAAIAITLGGGGIGLAQASISSGDKPVTVTVDARRILDTRTNVGLAGGFVKNTPREIQVTGSVDVVTDTGTAKQTVVPAGASAVLVNVTVVFPTDQGFLSLRAGGATGIPKTSTVNFTAGSVEPNAATVDLSADGKMQVWVLMPSATATADVLIDIVGYTTDHNHDDRYYTEDEVDNGLAATLDSAVALSGGATFAAGFNSSDISSTLTSFASVDVYVPTSGVIVTTASAELNVNNGDQGICYIYIDGVAKVSGGVDGPGLGTYANTTGAVVAAGVHTIDLQCQSGFDNQVDIWAPWISVVFSPNDIKFLP